RAAETVSCASALTHTLSHPSLSHCHPERRATEPACGRGSAAKDPCTVCFIAVAPGSSLRRPITDTPSISSTIAGLFRLSPSPSLTMTTGKAPQDEIAYVVGGFNRQLLSAHAASCRQRAGFRPPSASGARSAPDGWDHASPSFLQSPRQSPCACARDDSRPSPGPPASAGAALANSRGAIASRAQSAPA